jgi:coenzyme PQQ biosynthesis protein PqqD
VIADDVRPRLAAKVHLRADRASGGTLLLYPEAGLALNPTAAAVVRLLDGEHTVAAIVDELSARYGRREAVAHDVAAFLGTLADRGLLAR